MTNQAATICNICGSSEFLPGPNGRMARSGALPCCAGCGSLERHRGLRALLAPLPAAFFASRRALQFSPSRSPDRSLDPAWFDEYEEYIFTGVENFSLGSLPTATASVDFVSLSHMLEFEADDRAAFAELYRIMSPRAVLHVTFTSAMQSPTTTQFTPPKPPFGRHWDYGRDVVERFAVAARGLTGLMVKLTDPVTATSEPTHFFCKQAEDADFLAAQCEGVTRI